tara:strand:+ start:6644 stop:6910 length:267 start_codon:yes stop_codon:yes gene_type:complete
MEQEPPQGNILPFAIGGSFLLVCCLGPAFLASGGVGLFAWIGGIDGMLSIALTMAAFATIVVFRRIGKTTSDDARSTPKTNTLEKHYD